MPTSIKIPRINGLDNALAAAVARRKLTLANGKKLTLADMNDETLSHESFVAIQHYMAEITPPYIEKIKRNPAKQDDAINALAILIANRLAQLVEKDQKLSRVNREQSAINFQASTNAGRAPEDWANQVLPTIVADALSKEPNANKVVALGPLQDLEQAKELARENLELPGKTDAMVFVCPNTIGSNGEVRLGNHWQLVHAEKTVQGHTQVNVFNPMGDGACGHRAATKCMEILRNKHNMQFGLDALIPSDGDKKAVMTQVATLYRHVARTVSPERPVIKGSYDKRTAVKMAARELESTGAMLSGLTKIEKRTAIVASQQKMLDHYAQVKADRALAESLQIQENGSIQNDEALATALQAEETASVTTSTRTSTPASQIESDAALASELQAEFDSQQPRLTTLRSPAAGCREEAAETKRFVPPRLVK